MADALLGFTLNGANVGEFTQAFSATVAGSTRVFDADRMSISHRLSAASTADLYVRGFTPAEFSEVRLYNGGSGGDCLFGGHAVATNLDSLVRINDDPWWHLQCQDYTWLLNLYKRVRGTYHGIGVNTCLSRILSSFTEGGFRVGYCSSALGDVSNFVLEDVSVTDAINRLAEQKDAFWDIDADKRVHIFTTPDHLSTDSLTITNSSNNFSRLSVVRDGQDIATSVLVHGYQTQVTTRVYASATTVAVDDVEPFVGTGVGGIAFSGGIRFTYTGTSVTVGAGTLTGVSGLTSDIQQGDPVWVRGEASDGTAQSDLATLLGGGASGVAEIKITAERANVVEAGNLATAILERRKASFKSLGYDTYDQQDTGAQATVPGQTVAVTLTAPFTLSGTFRVQEIQLGLREGGKIAGSTLGFSRRVNLGPYQRSLSLTNALQGAWRHY